MIDDVQNNKFDLKLYPLIENRENNIDEESTNHHWRYFSQSLIPNAKNEQTELHVSFYLYIQTHYSHISFNIHLPLFEHNISAHSVFTCPKNLEGWEFEGHFQSSKRDCPMDSEMHSLIQKSTNCPVF